MAIDHQTLPEAAPQEQAGSAHLGDDLPDGYLRAKIVARDRNRDALRIQPCRHVAEGGCFERAPVAAMDEQRERRVAGRLRKKQVDGLARAGAVGKAEFGVLLRLHVFAISRGRLTPARKNLRMLGNTRPVVVLDFVVDHSLSRLAIGTLEDCRKRRKHEGSCPQLCPQPQSGLMTAPYESQRHAYTHNLART